jgi:sugar lactone lactonase YvrE
MTVDADHVYWANLVGQAIGRANLDGSEPEPNFIQLSPASFPEGVAIEGSHIYWASAGHGGRSAARISQAAKSMKN